MAKTVRPNLGDIKISDLSADYKAKMEIVKSNLASKLDEGLDQLGDSLINLGDNMKNRWDNRDHIISIFDNDWINEADNTGAGHTSRNKLPDDWNSPCQSRVDNQRQIYTYLHDMGLNEAAIAGVMGNVQAESTFNPKCRDMDTNGYYSTGLFQWNEQYTRAWVYGDTVESQMNYMAKNIKSKTLEKLKNVPNTVEGAKEAALIFAKEFEVCSSAYYEIRKTYAERFYDSF